MHQYGKQQQWRNTRLWIFQDPSSVHALHLGKALPPLMYVEENETLCLQLKDQFLFLFSYSTSPACMNIIPLLLLPLIESEC